MKKKKISFYINNLSYTINIEEEMENDVLKFISPDKPTGTQELLLAYIRRTQEFHNFKKNIEEILNNLPKV